MPSKRPGPQPLRRPARIPSASIRPSHGTGGKKLCSPGSRGPVGSAGALWDGSYLTAPAGRRLPARRREMSPPGASLRFSPAPMTGSPSSSENSYVSPPHFTHPAAPSEAGPRHHRAQHHRECDTSPELTGARLYLREDVVHPVIVGRNEEGKVIRFEEPVAGGGCHQKIGEGPLRRRQGNHEDRGHRGGA